MHKTVQWDRVAGRYPLFQVTVANITAHNEGKIHAHDFAEVFWVAQGRGIHLINGEKHPLKIGELCLMRPHRDTHKLQGRTADFVVANISFPKQTLEELIKRYFNSPFVWGGNEKNPIIYYITESERQWLNAATHTLKHSAQDRLLLDRFLLNLFCTLGHGQPDPWRACPPWLKTACETIRQPEYFTQGIGAFTTLCRRPYTHLARTLHKYTGQSPHDVINAARIHYAAGQLLTTTRGIQEIAAACGFESLSYFYRLFCKIFKTSPRQYRIAHYKPPIKAS